MGGSYRDDFWNFYVEMGFRSIYYQRYLLGCTRVSRTMDVFTLITSASSIAGWAIWSQYKMLWAVIIGASQLAAVIFPNLPMPKRATVLSIIFPMVDDVFKQTKRFWEEIENHSDAEVLATMQDLEERYDRLDAAISTSIDLPRKKRYVQYADRENQAAFKYRYDVQTGGTV